MGNDYQKKVVGALLLLILAVISFFILKPVLISVIVALILSFIFTPVYDWLYKYTKLRNLSAFLIVLFVLLIVILPIWFLTPILITQSFTVFQATQQIDFIAPLKLIFPGFFASEQFSAEVGSIISSFASRVANSIVNSLSDLVLNFPTLALQLLVVFFTFFYVLRDKEEVLHHVEAILPFSKEVEAKLFAASKSITGSVLYGQVIVGIIQGIIAGIGFFIFGVPNALFLTLLAIFGGILPLIGTALVWLPVSIYLFVGQNTTAGWGVLIFGVFSSTIDNFLRPIIVSRRTKIHSGVLLISMIGGFLFFGVLGFILGPLVIAYLLILMELYHGKLIPGIMSGQPKK